MVLQHLHIITRNRNVEWSAILLILFNASIRETSVTSISWKYFLSCRSCHECVITDCWSVQCHDFSKQQFFQSVGALRPSHSRWTVTRRSAAEGCFGETGSDAEGSSRVQQWPLNTFLKGKRTKLCGLNQTNNMLQMCFNKFRLLLSLPQFFSYRKPPKGYYIYGDVGKFCGIMLWLRFVCLVIEINCSVLLSMLIFSFSQAQEKLWLWTCFMIM